jgi:hypothetical protein
MGYAGFDSDQYPGDDQMAALAKVFDFCAYYLPAPSHRDAGWTGKRAFLQGLTGLSGGSFGVLPVYVGQETQGPGSHNVGGQQGVIDGSDAGFRMAAEGFAPRWACVLDLENGPPFSQLEGGYVQTWRAGVAGHGFRAMVYGSHLLIPALVAIGVPLLDIWGVKVSSVAASTAAAPFSTEDPSGCYPGISAWQHQMEAAIKGDGYDLTVDLDTATTADPGAPT